jgi:hypothetical protein
MEKRKFTGNEMLLGSSTCFCLLFVKLLKKKEKKTKKKTEKAMGNFHNNAGHTKQVLFTD